MATKFGEKLAKTPLVSEISPRFLRLWGFSAVGLSNGVSQILPPSTLVVMATKFEAKFATTPLVSDISTTSLRLLRLSRSFQDTAIKRCQSNSTRINPGCHGNEIWVKISYNSACIKDIFKILASIAGCFRSWATERVSQILGLPG